MITHSIKYGGVLQVGDFIAIGSNWEMSFGWYSGNGKTGNIQYIVPVRVVAEFESFNRRMKDPNIPINYKDKRGFSLEHISRQPVRQHNNNRVVKITCPDDIFTGRDLQLYLEAKRILTDMKF